MIDTFKFIFARPADDTLFRPAAFNIITPTGSIEQGTIPESKVWRDLDNEHSIRSYAEHRLIRAFPARKHIWHGSHVTYFNRTEGGSIVCIVEVESDHFDGSGLDDQGNALGNKYNRL